MLLSEVRSLTQELVTGKPLEPFRCSTWTHDHVAAATDESLSPWLYQSLRNQPISGLSRELLSEFRNLYAESLALTLASQSALGEVLGALAKGHIPVVLLKGGYLGPVVYGDPAARPMSDFDLLLRREDFSRGGQIIEKLGCTVDIQPPPGLGPALQPAVVYVRRTGVPATVDVHWALWAMDYYRFPSSVVWDEAREAVLHGHAVQFLSHELNFIHCAVHTLNHADRIRNWLDLALLVQRTNLDWGRLIQLGRSLGVLRPLYWVFDELGTNWGVSPPEAVSAAVRAYVPRWIEDRVIRHRLRYVWRLVARLRTIDGWGSRIRYVRQRMFPPREYRETLVGRSDWFAYLRSKLGLFWDLYRRDHRDRR